MMLSDSVRSRLSTKMELPRNSERNAFVDQTYCINIIDEYVNNPGRENV